MEQAGPFLLAVPAFGRVHGEVGAVVAGGAGGDIDEVAAQGGAAGCGVGEAGQGPGGLARFLRIWPARSGLTRLRAAVRPATGLPGGNNCLLVGRGKSVTMAV